MKFSQTMFIRIFNNLIHFLCVITFINILVFFLNVIGTIIVLITVKLLCILRGFAGLRLARIF